jgi:hypothetical protein
MKKGMLFPLRLTPMPLVLTSSRLLPHQHRPRRHRRQGGRCRGP